MMGHKMEHATIWEEKSRGEEERGNTSLDEKRTNWMSTARLLVWKGDFLYAMYKQTISMARKK